MLLCLYVQFEQEVIRVHDLEFEDCTTPSSAIVEKFLELVDKSKGVVAVHCLAGLGRTGTLISLWIMSRLGWSARECISWLRIVRPGSVLGTQQHYLEVCQHSLADGLPLPEPDAMQTANAARVAKSVMLAMHDRRHRHILRCSSAGGGGGVGEMEFIEEACAFAPSHHRHDQHLPLRKHTPAQAHASAGSGHMHWANSASSVSSCSSSASRTGASSKGSVCESDNPFARHISDMSDCSSTCSREHSLDGFYGQHGALAPRHVADVFQRNRHDTLFFPDDSDSAGDLDVEAESTLSTDWSLNSHISPKIARVLWNVPRV